MRFRYPVLLTTLVVILMVGLLVGGCGNSTEQTGADGKTLSIVIDSIPDRKAEADAIAGYLREIGVDAEVRVWEWNTLRESILAGERQVYTSDWGSATFDPYDLAVPKLKTDDRGNFSFYSNSEVDALLMQGSTGFTEEARYEAYVQAQQLIHEDAPWIFGYYKDSIEAASIKVQNWEPSMDTRINLHNVALTEGDTIVVGLRSDKILTLDPANYRDRETETVIRNIYDGLVTRTPDGEVVPELAKSWTNPEPTVYEFVLRDDVYFHNGQKMTADDVVFTFERIMAPDGIDGMPSPRLGLLGPLESVEKIDDYQVRFTLSESFPVFLQLLVHTQIIPKDYVEEVGAKGLAENPVGTGPYKYVSGRLDDQIVLERFDGYYGGSPDLKKSGKEPVKKVIFKNMPEPSTRVSALLAGEVHIIQMVPEDLAPRLEADPRVNVMTAEGTRVYGLEFNTAKEPFDDVRVRQAINYAVNWDEILTELYQGRAHRLSTAFLPSGFGYDPDLEPYSYNPEKAKELLREAGYRVND